ncbi:hypothetical protein K5549_021704, partial [Capra hircus]
DDASKKWVPAGGSAGFIRVHIYHHTGSNTFGAVGRKIQDHHQIRISCIVPKGLKYNQATQTFHPGRDARQVVFTSALMHALEEMAKFPTA